jgi:hypothetical protein
MLPPDVLLSWGYEYNWQYVVASVCALMITVNVLSAVFSMLGWYPGKTVNGTKYVDLLAYETVVLWPLGFIAFYGAYAALGYVDVLAQLRHDPLYARSGSVYVYNARVVCVHCC